ncbi:unnamed protein product [Choristocarpus tenellus]
MLYECGLIKGMTVELFKPFIIRQLPEQGIIKIVKYSKKIVEKKAHSCLGHSRKHLEGTPSTAQQAPHTV